MQTKVRAEWLDAAGALFLAGIRARAPLDAVVAKFLREHALGDDARAFVVDTAQGMWRRRARIEAAAKALSYEPTRGGLAALFLVAHGVDALPIDPRGTPELVAAWTKTASLPLAARYGVPALLEDRGEDFLAALTSKPPQTLRANTLQATRDEVAAALLREGIATTPTARSPDGLIVVERANVFRTAAFREGLFEVQDEGSQLVSLLCDVEPGMVVIDGCAGAGGKTLHLAALMRGKGTIHAFDVAGHRLEALRQRARRAGAHNVRVHDDIRDRKRVTGADVVLIDAPCSGTGVLRRNPDTAWKLGADDVARLVLEQRALLEVYAPLAKSRLVYATCSILTEENQGAVDDFLARHPELQRKKELVLDPLKDGTDGFYAAALQR